VPFLFVDPQTPDARLAPTGTLQDVAPTLLGILGIESPAEMTGRDLRLAA
jgi:2,3-bisphosphoglycerate-independent phosphoglycerate mutase